MRPAIWQPLITAPRDGTIVDLMLKGGGRYTDAWWEDDDNTWCGLEEEMFTHWAPLPECEPSRAVELPLWVFCLWLSGSLFLCGAAWWRVLL